MISYQAPGVYMEEINIGTKPIEGVSTSTAGFLGETERGEIKPQLITSWTAYQRKYGGYFGVDKYLPYAVEGFFKNGGKRCYIGRIAHIDSTTTYIAEATIGKLKLEAVGPGSWGNRIYVKVSKASIVEEDDTKKDEYIKLSLFYWKEENSTMYDPTIDKTTTPRPQVVEVFDNVSYKEDSIDSYKSKVNGVSNLVKITEFTEIPKLFEGKLTVDATNATVTAKTSLQSGGYENKEIYVLKATGEIVEKNSILSVDDKKITVENSWDVLSNLKKDNIFVIIQDKSKIEEEVEIEEVSGEKNLKIIKVLNVKKIYFLEIISADKVRCYKITDNKISGLPDDIIGDINSYSYKLLEVVDGTVSNATNATITTDTTEDLTGKSITMTSGESKAQTCLCRNHDDKVVTLYKSWYPFPLPKKDDKFCFCCAKLKNDDDDDEIVLADYNGKEIVNEKDATGLLAFTKIEDISILYAPNSQSVTGLTDALKTHCEEMQDRFLIIDAKKDDTKDLGGLKPRKDFASKYASYYFPWINIINPSNGRKLTIPPGGYVAGVYARTDAQRGVHKAPANEQLRGVVELDYPVTRAEQEVLNPRGVNCIRSFPNSGIRIWGARTLSSDTSWKYINVRRLFIYMEGSILQSSKWVVFEPNNELLWDRVSQTIGGFLKSVWKSGALMGRTPEEAFFVKCDRTTMTQSELDNGQLVVLIGVAPVKPAEFVIFRISQWTADADAQ